MNSLCCFFSPSLSAQGVQIPGLGTFTFTRQKLEVGNNKFILIQRPIFIMVEKLVQTHGLKQNKVHTPGKYISFLRLSQKVTSLGIKMKGQSLPSCCFIGFWCEELFSRGTFGRVSGQGRKLYTVFLWAILNLSSLKPDVTSRQIYIKVTSPSHTDFYSYFRS